MMQEDLFDPVRLARTDDPETSKAAARQAKGVVVSHEARILRALAAGPASSYRIAERMGVPMVAVARRMKALVDRGEVAAVDTEKGPTGRAVAVYGLFR